MLAGADFLIGPSREVALIGEPHAFLPILRKRYLPRTVIAAGTSERIALLGNRIAVGGKPTAYLCENYVCEQPTTEATVLEEMLRC